MHTMNNKLTGSYSMCLDIVRFYAALSVFVRHIQHGWFGDVQVPFMLPSHSAVVLFFVLSGYVIAYSQERRPRGLGAFIQARLMRFWATTIPALAVSIICLICLWYINAELFADITKKQEPLRYLASLLNIQSIWFRHFSPGINGPFWSLSYEFFYYLMFATATTCKKQSNRILLTALAALLAGPGILLLLPAWLLGVLCYKYHECLKLSALHASIMLVLGATGVYTLNTLGIEYPLSAGTPPLNFSSAYVSDWLLAIGYASIFIALRHFLSFSVSKPALVFCRRLGDLTFPVYLFHTPILAVAADSLELHRCNLAAKTQLLC